MRRVEADGKPCAFTWFNELCVRRFFGGLHASTQKGRSFCSAGRLCGGSASHMRKCKAMNRLRASANAPLSAKRMFLGEGCGDPDLMASSGKQALPVWACASCRRGAGRHRHASDHAAPPRYDWREMKTLEYQREPVATAGSDLSIFGRGERWGSIGSRTAGIADALV